MKKKLFVIPIVSLILFIVLLITSLPIQLKAQVVGCHVSFFVDERLYYTPYPFAGLDAWITTGTIDASGATGGYRESGSSTYGCIKDLGSSCTVYQSYLTSGGILAVRVYRTGVLANIAPVNCPLDDYVIVLFIFTIGLVFLRSKKQLQIILK